MLILAKPWDMLDFEAAGEKLTGSRFAVMPL